MTHVVGSSRMAKSLREWWAGLLPYRNSLEHTPWSWRASAPTADKAAIEAASVIWAKTLPRPASREVLLPARGQHADGSAEEYAARPTGAPAVSDGTDVW